MASKTNALARFQEQHSNWQVRVQIRRGRDRILGVTDGTFDLAIVSHDVMQIRGILGAAGVMKLALQEAADRTFETIDPSGFR